MECSKINHTESISKFSDRKLTSLLTNPNRQSAFKAYAKEKCQNSFEKNSAPDYLQLKLGSNIDHKQLCQSQWNTFDFLGNNVQLDLNTLNFILNANSLLLNQPLNVNFTSVKTEAASFEECSKEVNNKRLSFSGIMPSNKNWDLKHQNQHFEDNTYDQKLETYELESNINLENKVGFYTKKERQLKIQKYREKVLKWMRGENKNKDRYRLRSLIAKNKPRVGGKFAKKASKKIKKK